jgi:uncharacterized protein YecE (DUF72 family)
MIGPQVTRVRAGTSGFSYEEWHGPFYPEGLKAGERLRYYAGRLATVEINNTFYRMPKAELMLGWKEQVPEGFRFALKAPRRITHIQRLREPAASLPHLYEVAGALGDRLGPILFQLPPNLKLDLERLRAFLDALPPGTMAAFEFRHPSWHEEPVRALLAERGVALCAVDGDEEERNAPLLRTADFAYLRLRRPGYDDAELGRFAAAVAALGCREAYVYFKHEDAGAGPRLAERFLALAGGG